MAIAMAAVAVALVVTLGLSLTTMLENQRASCERGNRTREAVQAVAIAIKPGLDPRSVDDLDILINEGTLQNVDCSAITLNPF